MISSTSNSRNRAIEQREQRELLEPIEPREDDRSTLRDTDAPEQAARTIHRRGAVRRTEDVAPRSGDRAPARRLRIDGALFVLFATLLVLEALSRLVLVNASKDLRRFSGYAERATALDRFPGLRVALIGNSATDRGVDASLFARALAAKLGRHVAADKFVADASRINTWHFILKRYFWDEGRHADLFVVTFYEDDLEDGNRVEIGRLAHFFARPRDWPSVFAIDLPELDDKLDFVLSSGSAVVAERARIKERTLGLLVPGYHSWLPQVNDVNRDHERRVAARVSAPAARATSLRALDRLLDLAREHGARLLFVAYPTLVEPGAERYRVNPEVLRRIQAAGMLYLDMRDGDELTSADYADPIHLSPAGAAIYTKALADRSAEFRGTP